ncbi:hypothetical protein DFH29DRAFT_871457 [Suillus ampliporus]|nr:hypothetical protein DFH29DRAFT_871457 [Suillus ampliporus]
MLEAQREELLRSTVLDCTRRNILERDFMEEKKDRCQLEVSLCSQAIEYMEQHLICETLQLQHLCVLLQPQSHMISLLSRQLSGYIPSPLAVVHSAAAVVHSTAVQMKCETWLWRQNNDHIPTNEPPLLPNDFTPSPSIGPSFRLMSTWVPTEVQEAFDQACKVELSTQVGLMTMYLDIEGYHSHQRNAKSELIFLRAKLCRTKAEAEVYALAIENAPVSSYSDGASCPNSPAASTRGTSRSVECIIVPLMNGYQAQVSLYTFYSEMHCQKEGDGHLVFDRLSSIYVPICVPSSKLE